MKYTGTNFERDENGRIIVDNFIQKVKKKYETRGKREKFWLVFDDKKVLFKKINPSTFEDYAELLAEEMYNQVGLPAAKYDLAILNGEFGVLSENFLENDETLISGNQFLINRLNAIHSKTTNQEKYHEKMLNNLVTIKAVLEKSLPSEQYRNEIKKFYMMFGINCMTLQGDIHWRNWSVVVNNSSDKQRYKLSPLYDSAGMCRFSRGKNKLYGIYIGFVKMSKNDENSRAYLEDYMFSKTKFDRDSIMKYAPDSPSYMGVSKIMEAFYRDPKLMAPVVKKMCLLDPQLAVHNVETRIGCEMPDLAKKWFISVINKNVDLLKNQLSNYYQNMNTEIDKIPQSNIKL